MAPDTVGKNPANWRVATAPQVRALSDILDRAGWAACALYNKRTKRLIDGHKRRGRGRAPTTALPILAGDWDEETERYLLAVLDTITDMAHTDTAAQEARWRRSPHSRTVCSPPWQRRVPPGTRGQPGRDLAPDDLNEEPDEVVGNVQLIFGHLRTIMLEHQAFHAWLDDLRFDVGFADEDINQEIRRRLMLP